MTRQATRIQPGRGRSQSLRHRLIIEAPTYLSDGAGGADRQWQVRAEVWASIEPVAMQRIVLDDRAGQRITYSVRLRWRADLTAEMRLRCGPRLFRLYTVVDPDGRRRWLECLATEDAP